jgi:hypothetical protein
MSEYKGNFKLQPASGRRAYSGYVLVERGIDFTATSGLIVHRTAKNERDSLVLSVGPEVAHGVEPGDLITYTQGTTLEGGETGPNGGIMFTVLENQIGSIVPHDGREVKSRG